jgi:glycosyltransferase involved in cell wall biosynthesis
MSKKKILFVVSDFYHNGAQREMYEFDCALDKAKFEVTILSLTGLNTRLDLPDYFYEKHLQLGSEVLFLKDFVQQFNKRLLYKILNKLLKNLLYEKIKKNNCKNLITLFNKYDQVAFMGEYVYQHLSPIIPVDYFKRILIFIMSTRFQDENYRYFEKNNRYLFFTGFSSLEEIEYEFEGFNNYKHQFMPLCLKVTEEYYKWKFNEQNKQKKIGIFTRLHKDKPLDPFLYAYQILLSQSLDVELHVFGVGNYKLAEYDRYINNLGLNGKVHFRGHQPDMKTTILEEKLDLVWFQGYNNSPAGYAGLEVCLTGTPQLFWDFFIGENPQLNSLNDDVIYPHFKNLTAFTEASKMVLSDNKIAESISIKQYQDVFNNRNIFKRIHIIENSFLENE